MRGIVRIGGAAAVGVLVILGSFYLRNRISTGEIGEIVVSNAPARTYIENKDLNRNGISDWKEDLEKDFRQINHTGSTSEQTAVNYIPPTTLTGKFSEAFLKDYLEGKMKGKDFSDPTPFVASAVEAIDKNAQSPTHSQSELKIVPTTPESLRLYGNEVVRIMTSNSVKGADETIILNNALRTNDPTILSQLDPIQEAYRKSIAESLLLDVPTELVNQHIALLNAYESVLSDISAMKLSFDDPLFSLARVRKYRENKEAFMLALQDIATVLRNNNVTYTEYETGLLFKIFKP